jgi:TonB family protein
MKGARIVPLKFLTCAVAAMLSLSPAPSPAAESQILNPDWLQKPDGEQMGWAYPPMAAALAIEGETTLSCGVTAEGLLRDCSVVRETPSDLGFAAASLLMTRYFRMSPKMVDGRGVAGGQVRIPLHFKLPDPNASYSPGPPTSGQALNIARELVVAENLRDRLSAQFSKDAPLFANWERPNLAPTLTAAGREAMAAAFEIDSRPWIESAARTYAALFTADELAARLAFVRSPAGQALTKKREDLDALIAPTQWIAFQVGMTIGRKSFCETHACARDIDSTGKLGAEPAASITTADWIESPNRTQVIGAIPFLARPLKLAGEVKLRCGVSVIGSLSGCKAIYETPKGFGFSDAAIRLSSYYRAQPLPPDLAPKSPTVDLVVRFPEFPTQVPAFRKMPLADRAPSDERLALARKLVAADGFDEFVVLDNDREMKDFDRIPSPGVDGRTRVEVRDALSKGIAAAAMYRRDGRIRQYASLFSEAELEGMIEWEMTPSAKAFRNQQSRSTDAMIAQWKVFSAVIEKRAGRIFCAKRDCKPFVQPDKSQASSKTPTP